jgi:hypothetical protein
LNCLDRKADAGPDRAIASSSRWMPTRIPKCVPFPASSRSFRAAADLPTIESEIAVSELKSPRSRVDAVLPDARLLPTEAGLAALLRFPVSQRPCKDLHRRPRRHWSNCRSALGPPVPLIDREPVRRRLPNYGMNPAAFCHALNAAKMPVAKLVLTCPHPTCSNGRSGHAYP